MAQDPMEQVVQTLREAPISDAQRDKAYADYKKASTPEQFKEFFPPEKSPWKAQLYHLKGFGNKSNTPNVGQASAAGPPKQPPGVRDEPWFKRATKAGQPPIAEIKATMPSVPDMGSPLVPDKASSDSRSYGGMPILGTDDPFIMGGMMRMPESAVQGIGKASMKGKQLISMLLGKAMGGGAAEEAGAGAAGESEITSKVDPAAKPQFSDQRNPISSASRQIPGRAPKQIAGPPPPPSPPDRVFEQGPISRPQIEGPRNPATPPGVRPLPRPGSAGPPRQIAARPSGPNPQPTWDMTLAWAKRLPPEELQGIVQRMKAAVAEHGASLSPEEQALSAQRLKALENLAPKQAGKPNKPNAVDMSDRAKQAPVKQEPERAAPAKASAGGKVSSVHIDKAAQAIKQAKQWGSKRAMVTVYDASGKELGEMAFNPASADVSTLQPIAKLMAKGAKYRVESMEGVGQKMEAPIGR